MSMALCVQAAGPTTLPTSEVLAQADHSPLVVAIDRDQPVKFFDEIPSDWLARSASDRTAIHLTGQPGEYRVFQIAVLSRDTDRAISAKGMDAKSAIAKDVECLSLEGIDFRGQPFKNNMTAKPGRVQPLWFGIDLPKETGQVTRTIELSLGDAVIPVQVSIDVTGELAIEHGDHHGANLSRLRWLNSTRAQDQRMLAPFTPVKVDGSRFDVLGRTLTLTPLGLPAQVESHFNAGNTAITTESRTLLKNEVTLQLSTDSDAGHLTRPLSPSAPMSVVAQENGTAEWNVTATNENFKYTCAGHLDPDGVATFKMTLEAVRDVETSEMALNIPYERSATRFAMGLGLKGGKLEKAIDWHWDTKKNQDGLWLGDVNVGARWRFYDENFRRPLVNVYYNFSELKMPPSWWNEGKGGMTLKDGRESTDYRIYTGPRTLKKGDILHFNFDMMMTPFKPIDTEKQWAKRFIHPFEGSASDRMEKALVDGPAAGANVMNVHHATTINPHINYPYYDASIDDLSDFVKRAHDKNLLLKVYYTTRELTTSIPELWALRSLGDPVIFPGPGNSTSTYIHKTPDKWLKDNLRENYIPAWVHKNLPGKFKSEPDISVITTPDSRWNNFYIEGLNYLVERTKIDGLYIDDTALDRNTMRRARAVLTSQRPEVMIDLHSWNHFRDVAGWTSSAFLYIDLMPYLDRLWLGEGFDYNAATPDYWLVEMSGIPFGMMSEMLQGGGNPYRGMVFGETNRLGWSGSTPQPFWKQWDAFGMKGSQMIGWWDPTNPIHASSEDVKVTIYKHNDRVMIAIASWAKEKTSVTLNIDYKALGFEEGKVTLTRPAIDKVQTAAELDVSQAIEIEPKKGFVLELRKKQG